MDAAPGVLLRPLRHADAEVLAVWGDDPRFRAECGWAPGPSHDAVAAFHRRTVDEPPADLLRLAATVDDRLVGYVDLHGDEPDRRELGFLVGPRSAWGRGLGTRVALAGLAHGFGVLGLHEVWAEAAETNAASLRVLRRIGMSSDGEGSATAHLARTSRCLRFVLTRSGYREQRHAPGETSPDS